MYRKLLLFFCLSFFWLVTFAQLTITITEVPLNTPPKESLFLAGNINNWQANDPNTQLTNNGDGTYSLTLSAGPGEIEFKFTRGNWDAVEGDSEGQFLPNRKVYYSGGVQTEELTIASWEDLDGSKAKSTATDNVYVLSNNFFIPQLNRERRIWVYLPPDYKNSSKRYPVLYVHDAQNVFDRSTSFSGEWNVDETLNGLFDNGDDGIIVVGIENGGIHRIDEYAPFENPEYGGGEGAQYMSFIINTLKPQMDETYRTLPQREHTGIMGSSMGGLISLYGAIEYQQIFSKAAVFSPSLWFSDDIFDFVAAKGKKYDMRIFFVGGVNEGGSMMQKVNQMYYTLRGAGFQPSELWKTFHWDGAHSEWYWAREFPWAYLWLYGSSVTKAQEIATPSANLMEMEKWEKLMVDVRNTDKKALLKLYDQDGNKVLKKKFKGASEVDLKNIPKGVYRAQLKYHKGDQLTKTIEVGGEKN